jgi:hypothetical protein
MTLRQKIAKKIILAGDPHAFDDGTLLAEVERHEQRLANDPEVQRRRAEAREMANRENLPILVGGILFNALLWGAIAWFLPGLVKPAFAALAFALISAAIWKTLRG